MSIWGEGAFRSRWCITGKERLYNLKKNVILKVIFCLERAAKVRPGREESQGLLRLLLRKGSGELIWQG